jgi:EAL domain-containing protein (putative c-di-GMP-specific phosphodiesterase class I)
VEGLRLPGGLVDHARQAGPEGEAVMGDLQRLTDIEQLEIFGSLEAASTERSAMRAARALAELMRHLHALGQRIAAELPDQDRDGNPVGPRPR